MHCNLDSSLVGFYIFYLHLSETAQLGIEVAQHYLVTGNHAKHAAHNQFKLKYRAQGLALEAREDLGEWSALTLRRI